MTNRNCKLIRVKDATFQDLTKLGNWNDTMDSIITRLMKRSTAVVKHKEA